MTTRTIRSILSSSLALAAGAIAACSSGKPATADSASGATASTTPTNVSVTPEQRQRIHIITIAPTAFRPVIEATGTVAFNGDRSTQVLSPVSGPITRILVLPGDVVKRGQPMAEVSSPDFAAAVATYRKAQTAFRNAKRIAERDSALFKNDALARGDLEQAQSDQASAEADVEAAVQAMKSLGVEDEQIKAIQEGRFTPFAATIKAPFDGTVVEKLVAQGQLLQAGTTAAFTVADLNTMWVMTSVFANDIANVAVGEGADVITDVTATPIAGRVDYIASLADPATKAVSVRVVVPNTGRTLRRDMFVRVQIKGGTEQRGILVPVSSVLRDDQNLPYVFVAAEGNAFARRSIGLGPRVGLNNQILTGLNPGDRVVTDGALFLSFVEAQ